MALIAIHNEWKSGKDCNIRVGNVSGEKPLIDRLNGDYYLKKGGDTATVFDDTEVDNLLGSGEMDWLFFDPLQDSVPGKKKGERRN